VGGFNGWLWLSDLVGSGNCDMQNIQQGMQMKRVFESTQYNSIFVRQVLPCGQPWLLTVTKMT
jgi:hypothetical protein